MPQSGCCRLPHASWNWCMFEIVADPIGSKTTLTSSLSILKYRIHLCSQPPLLSASYFKLAMILVAMLCSLISRTLPNIVSAHPQPLLRCQQPA